MKHYRTLLLILLAAGPASSTPCMSHNQLGEYAELELLSVTADGAPVTDVSDYAAYQVAIQAELPPGRADDSASYVRFSARREHMDSFGRSQSEMLGEFYPAY